MTDKPLAFETRVEKAYGRWEAQARYPDTGWFLVARDSHFRLKRTALALVAALRERFADGSDPRLARSVHGPWLRQIVAELHDSEGGAA